MDTQSHYENPSSSEGFVGDEDTVLLRHTIEGYGPPFSKNFSTKQWNKIKAAIEFTLEAYGNDTRKDGTLSVNHKLRAGLHTLQFFETRDPDIVCAAFLHDVVEDFVNKKRALSYSKAYAFLNEKFGDRVAYLVRSVTIEPVEGLSEEKAREHYLEYFKNTIQDPDVFYVKLADFLDNGTNFINMPDEHHEKRIRVAQKYLPLYDICIARLQQKDITIPTQNIEALIAMLVAGRENARAVITEDS